MDAGVVTMKAQSTFRTNNIAFKLNKEFDKTTVDEKTKTVITFENGKLVQKQTWGGKTILECEIQDGKLMANCIKDDVELRTYEKEA